MHDFDVYDKDSQEFKDVWSWAEWIGIADVLKNCNVWIAGGCLMSYFSGQTLTSDIDIFSYNQDNIDIACRYFEETYSQKPTSEFETIVNYWKEGKKFQFVKRYFKNPIDCIDQFDFTVCCVALNKDRLIIHKRFFMDLARRRLVLHKLFFPLSTMQRIQKYVKKGFWICNGGLLDIANAIQNVNFQDPNQNVLEFYPNGDARFVRMD